MKNYDWGNVPEKIITEGMFMKNHDRGIVHG